MRKAFVPDRIYRRIADIDIDRDIMGRGFKLAILDIDGTLKNRILRRAPKDTEKWVRACLDKGLYVALVSNDRRNRHIEFAGNLDLPLIAAAHKPSPDPIRWLLKEYGVEPEDAVMIGNNPFTDILCAHRAGVSAYWVRPIETTRLKDSRKR